MAASEPQYPHWIEWHKLAPLLQEAESASAMLEYEPAAQGVHVELLFAPVALECVPLAHGLHVSELFAPVSVEYVPAGQS